MGWNTRNKFGCAVDENLIRQAAEAMASSGKRDAGHVYLVIDDCWPVGATRRDATRRERQHQPNPQRFPSG